MKNWRAMHEQLWPRVDIPKMLSPSSQSRELLEKEKIAQGGFQEVLFPEATLPTSLLISAVCSQAFASAKRNFAHRRAAILLLRSLIQQSCATGQVSVVLTPPGTNAPYRFRVPVSGVLPTAMLVAPEIWEELRDVWTFDAEAGICSF